MKKILVAGPSWVGDMVMAQSLFSRLAEIHPGCEIHVTAPPWGLPLISRMPQAARGWPLDVGHGQFGLGARRQLGRALRDENFDLAIVIPRSWKSALAPFFAHIPIRRGYRGEMRHGLLNDIRHLDKTRFPRTVDRMVALAGERPPEGACQIAPPRLTVDREAARQLARKKGLALDAPIIALCAGAEYGPAKQWPLEHYGELARAVIAKGHGVWIIGSAKDRPAGEEIAAQAPGAANLCGETNLLEAVDLMALAGGVVSNDSGLMHVAAALDIPLVALFGSSSPGMTPPLSDKAVILERDLDCRPCFKRECPLGHLRCLRGISVDEALGVLSLG